MDLGGIAAVIAASAFLVLALAVAVPLVRMGKVMNEAARTVRVSTDELIPVIREAKHSLETVNFILDQAKAVTAKVSDVAGAVTNVVEKLPLSQFAALARVFRHFVPGSTRE